SETRPPQPEKAPAKKKDQRKQGYYHDSSSGFSIKLPDGWQKINTKDIPTDNFARHMSSSINFKGPEWKGQFPLLLIQKYSNPLGAGINIDSKMLHDLEKELRSIFNYSTVNLNKLSSRTTLVGNKKAGEVDVVFSYQDQTFHMKSFVMESNTGFLLSYMTREKDFNASANQAIQAIRTFRQD
ncbi:MAG: hypothetical protein P9M03_11870, partial [Candidatus Theseobacter exili]|nr:hypothetical protein [Candidatus Theseobacter exili]